MQLDTEKETKLYFEKIQGIPVKNVEELMKDQFNVAGLSGWILAKQSLSQQDPVAAKERK